MAVTLVGSASQTVALATTLTEVLGVQSYRDLVIATPSTPEIRLFDTGTDGGAAGVDYLALPPSSLVSVPGHAQPILLAAASGTPSVGLRQV